MMEQDREKIDKQHKSTTHQIQGLFDQGEDLTRTVNGLKAERKERETTLAEKDVKIEGYREKVNALRCLKQVLDKRLSEVTQSLRPKDQMIDQLNRHLLELEGEFERVLLVQRELQNDIYQRNQQVATIEAEVKRLQDQIRNQDRLIDSFTYDLNSLVREQKDIELWPKEIRRMYHVHVCGLRIGADRMPMEKMQREMRRAEFCVTSLAVKEGRAKASGKAAHSRYASSE